MIGENVLNQAVDNSGERHPDDDADSEIDHIAAHDEGTKFTNPIRLPDREWCCSSIAHRLPPFGARDMTVY
jgi:hypothetical protein